MNLTEILFKESTAATRRGYTRTSTKYEFEYYLDKYKDDPYVMVSFQDNSSLHSDYEFENASMHYNTDQTPKGIYGYPVKSANHLLVDWQIPYGSRRAFILFFRFKNPDRVWVLGENDQIALDKLEPQYAKIFGRKTTQQLYNFVVSRYNYDEKIRNILKLDGIIDNGKGVIYHHGEPFQGFALANNAIELLHVVRNKKEIIDKNSGKDQEQLENEKYYDKHPEVAELVKDLQSYHEYSQYDKDYLKWQNEINENKLLKDRIIEK